MGCFGSKDEYVDAYPASSSSGNTSSNARGTTSSATSGNTSGNNGQNVRKDGADVRMTLEQSTAETDALYKKHRASADHHAQMRTKYYEEASAAHKAGNGKQAKELSDKGKEEGRLMEESSLKAARAIFAAKNQKQNPGCIDLHGLQVKEAELIVAEQLQQAKNKGHHEMKIIVGAGHHSDKSGPKIGPAVKKMLEGQGMKWAQDETNASGGCIVVRF